MSETQSDTDQEIDAGPTPGLWRTWQAGEDPLINEECVLAEHPDKQEPLLVAEMNRTANDHTDFPGHWKANARLIAAAGTAAQQAREMGYNPVAAVEALPNLLSAAERMLNAVQSNDPSETGAQRPDGEAVMSLQGALASAEGSEE